MEHNSASLRTSEQVRTEIQERMGAKQPQPKNIDKYERHDDSIVVTFGYTSKGEGCR